MTSKRLDDLFRHCADLQVDVEWGDLGDDTRGEYDSEGDVIRLHHALTEREVVSVLAHEIGHRHFGDVESTAGNERRAWEYAAAMLLTPEEYEVAESIAGHHPCALALELGVTPELIVAWRRWWTRRGQFLPRWKLARL